LFNFVQSCSVFLEKARLLESVGAKGAIVLDNNKGTSSANTPLFAMSGDGTDDVRPFKDLF
jgi:mannosidase alpha-like ER degradation enhancer 3